MCCDKGGFWDKRDSCKDRNQRYKEEHIWGSSVPSAQARADSQWVAQLSLSFLPTRIRGKQHPEMSPLATLKKLCAPSCPAAAPRRNDPYPCVAHLAAGSHMRALCPLQSSWVGICGVGGDRQTSGSFPHRAGDQWDFCPSGLHMTRMF